MRLRSPEPVRFGAGAFGETLVVESGQDEQAIRESPARQGTRIRREFFVKGKSIKEIVLALGISPNTVKKVLWSGSATITVMKRSRRSFLPV